MKEEVEAVKIRIASLHIDTKVTCDKGEEVKILATALAAAQEWGITELEMPDYEYYSNIGLEAWEALGRMAGSGKVETLSVVDIYCMTSAGVKTVCRALSCAQQWRSDDLWLGGNVGAEGWEALTEVVERGRVDKEVVVRDRSVLRAASEQQIYALWRAIKEEGR